MSACFCLGPDQRITSGPAAIAAASRWRQASRRKQAEYMTAPERFAEKSDSLLQRGRRPYMTHINDRCPKRNIGTYSRRNRPGAGNPSATTRPSTFHLSAQTEARKKKYVTRFYAGVAKSLPGSASLHRLAHGHRFFGGAGDGAD